MRYKLLLQSMSLIMGAVVLLSYNDDPPNGRTGAPFNGHCGDCHTGNNPGGYNGMAEITGLPDTILPNTTYPLKIKIQVTAGNPVRAGFQLVVVDKNDVNAGNLSAINNETDTEFLSAREYLDHRSGKYFGGMPVSWDFEWTSPADAPCNTLRFYYIANFCNGSGDFGDFPIAFADTVFFAGGVPLTANVTTIQNNTCQEEAVGIVQAQASGGTPPYQYQWPNGSTGPLVSALVSGTYSATVSDARLCTFSDSTIVGILDSIPPAIICPASYYACENDTVQFVLPEMFDNCEFDNTIPTLVNGSPNNTVFPPGSTVQIFQATDATGNTATCSFIVQVNTRPTITLDTIVHDANNEGIGSISTSVAEGSGGITSLAWEKDGLPFSVGTEDLENLLAGAYSLVVSDNQGCTAALGPLVVENTVGTSDFKVQSAQFVVAPQPVHGSSFHVIGEQSAHFSVEVIDLHGQTICTFSASTWPGPYFIGDLPNGVYLLRLTSPEGHSGLLKLVIAR